METFLHRQQMAQRVDRDVHLGAFAALGPVVRGAGSALGRGLQGTAVDADRRRLALAPAELAQQRLHVLDEWKYGRSDPFHPRIL